MNPNRMANHRRGEKAKLLSAVQEVCARLERPICSGDLNAFFREHPERRPCLLKRLGQQLLSASDITYGAVPCLKRIGIFRYKAYYALKDTEVTRTRFSDYCAEEQIAELLRLNIPDHIATLIENDQADLGAHAASGWLAEIAALATKHSNSILALVAADSDWDFMKAHAKNPFLPWGKWPLIGRDEASHLLVREAESRRFWDTPLSPFRYLVRYRWPQSVLFPSRLEYHASVEQLFHFIRGKWPLGDEDEVFHRAMAECLRYGMAENV
jgi:hypothetical protein